MGNPLQCSVYPPTKERHDVAGVVLTFCNWVTIFLESAVLLLIHFHTSSPDLEHVHVTKNTSTSSIAFYLQSINCGMNVTHIHSAVMNGVGREPHNNALNYHRQKLCVLCGGNYVTAHPTCLQLTNNVTTRMDANTFLENREPLKCEQVHTHVL